MDKPFRSLFIQIILLVIMSFFAQNSSISSQSSQIKGIIFDEVIPRTTDRSFRARTDEFGRGCLYRGNFTK